MTNSQSKLFSKMLDANWKCKEAKETNNHKKYLKAKQELDRYEEMLKDDMGEDEYENFVNAGRKMFAST